MCIYIIDIYIYINIYIYVKYIYIYNNNKLYMYIIMRLISNHDAHHVFDYGVRKDLRKDDSVPQRQTPRHDAHFLVSS